MFIIFQKKLKIFNSNKFHILYNRIYFFDKFADENQK